MVLQRRNPGSGVIHYASPLIERMNVPHGFSTRLGGVSAAPFDSMNLGNPSGCALQDDNARITENYRRLKQAIGCDNLSHHYLHQIHGDGVAVVDSDQFDSSRKGDALVTCSPGRVLSMRIADCCPILIATPGGVGVAAVHAGWRGAVAGVIARAIEKLSEVTGVSPRDMTAAIGPCIGFDSLEVGIEVLAEFDRVFGDQSPVRRDLNGKGHVNLPEACRLQLLASGVYSEQIDTTDRCTYRDADEFYSHRRDHGVTGRMAALIGIR